VKKIYGKYLDLYYTRKNFVSRTTFNGTIEIGLGGGAVSSCL